MRDKQVMKTLESWDGFSRGLISLNEPPKSKNLSEILETSGEHLQKFYLSAKAAAGILRRAEKRGKTLPELLRLALEEAASRELTGPHLDT